MLDREDLRGLSLADVLEQVEKGKVGYAAVMDWLHITSLNELVEIMHANGRSMPAHRPMKIPAETRALLRQICRPMPKLAAE
jgi:hypothetical protein